MNFGPNMKKRESDYAVMQKLEYFANMTHYSTIAYAKYAVWVIAYVIWEEAEEKQRRRRRTKHPTLYP